MKQKCKVAVMIVLAMLCLVACGKNNDMNTEKGNANQSSQSSTAITGNEYTTENGTDTGQREDKDNPVEDVAEGVGEAADDVADGIGDAIDNMGGGSFDSYKEAKKYLLEKLEKDNANAHYEIRDEKEELSSYNTNDKGAEGYEFSVYETDRNEKIGIYYVDKDNGKIYRYMGKDSIESY